MPDKKRRINAPVERVIGAHIRNARAAAHMNQSELASAMKVSFQQVQKYEQGQNRLAVSRLPQLSKALGRQVVIELVNKIIGA